MIVAKLFHFLGARDFPIKELLFSSSNYPRVSTIRLLILLIVRGEHSFRTEARKVMVITQPLDVIKLINGSNGLMALSELWLRNYFDIEDSFVSVALNKSRRIPFLLVLELPVYLKKWRII